MDRLAYDRQALHSSFNSAQNHTINLDMLKEIASKPITKWNPFSEEEFTSAIVKCNNSSIPGLDKLLWRYFKRYVKNITYLKNFIAIANMCVELEYWPLHFKVLTTIIISKSNKKSYNTPKAF